MFQVKELPESNDKTGIVMVIYFYSHACVYSKVDIHFPTSVTQNIDIEGRTLTELELGIDMARHPLKHATWKIYFQFDHILNYLIIPKYTWMFPESKVKRNGLQIANKVFKKVGTKKIAIIFHFRTIFHHIVKGIIMTENMKIIKHFLVGIWKVGSGDCSHLLSALGCMLSPSSSHNDVFQHISYLLSSLI